MPKIAFIGAGSLGFTRRLVMDILTYPALKDSQLALMDIDEERLKYAKLSVDRIIREGNYPARALATMDRKEALKGADIVITTLLAHGVQVFRKELEIPEKYGVTYPVGDSMSVAGFFRFCRTVPMFLEIAHDMERLCPDAHWLNYTNPMSMLCRAIQKTTSLKIVGLCHSVQGIAEMLAHWIGAPMDEITYVCAGINHQAWYIDYRWNGKDAYPLIHKAIAKKEHYDHERVLCEMCKRLDYFVTESSGHNSEYNWWFRKRPDLIEKYCQGTGWNPGKTNFIIELYDNARRTWRKDMKNWVQDPKPLDLTRSHEYASRIINALLGDTSCEINGNIPNTGLITNLPQEACVEVPVLINRRGFNPIHVGSLPPQLAAINNANIAVQEMAVEAALTGNERLLYHACALDPLAAATLSLAEIEKMFDELMRALRKYMPMFQ